MGCCDPPATFDIETTDAEHQLAVRGFVALWHGYRPQLADLDADPANVEALQLRGLIVLGIDERITGIHGLSAEPTAHQINHPRGAIHTWCAFDALGIPAALGIDAETRTTCPTCGRQLEVRFTAGQPTAEPDLRLWLPATRCEHVLNDLCAHANLYCDQHHLSANQTRPTGGDILTVALGRVTWRDAATALQDPVGSAACSSQGTRRPISLCSTRTRRPSHSAGCVATRR